MRRKNDERIFLLALILRRWEARFKLGIQSSLSVDDSWTLIPAALLFAHTQVKCGSKFEDTTCADHVLEAPLAL